MIKTTTKIPGVYKSQVHCIECGKFGRLLKIMIVPKCKNHMTKEDLKIKEINNRVFVRDNPNWKSTK